MEQILWSLSEALKERTCHRLSMAECVGLIRDERHGRLLVRYRAVLSGTLECVVGVLGQAKDYADGTGHMAINEATTRIARVALEPLTSIPRGLKLEGAVGVSEIKLSLNKSAIQIEHLQAKPQTQTLDASHIEVAFWIVSKS